ncbi:transposable element Tcb1 transposase [Trichonephila clavipes]|nr:transposable element Tcb1 transposase [Trichonephila clavipes]
MKLLSRKYYSETFVDTTVHIPVAEVARLPDPSPVEHVWDMMEMLMHLPGNVADLARQQEQIWQEVPQKTIWVLYHPMPRRVAACIKARGGLTPY